MRERAGDGEFQGADGVEVAGAQYRTYKRRWFGLVQLTLMNVMVSWDVSLLPLPSRADEHTDQTVAHLCARRLQSQRVLLRPGEHHQLDQHGLLPRLCLHLPSRHRRPPPQPSYLFHRRRRAHPRRELDPLCWSHEPAGGQRRARHGR